jgi:DNA polymerase-3 subunit beta
MVTLTLLATDIEIQITTSTPVASNEGDGAVTVGARKLAGHSAFAAG